MVTCYLLLKVFEWCNDPNVVERDGKNAGKMMDREMFFSKTKLKMIDEEQNFESNSFQYELVQGFARMKSTKTRSYLDQIWARKVWKLQR